jgi:phosphoglycerate dehydrogenase-like enzyme
MNDHEERSDVTTVLIPNTIDLGGIDVDAVRIVAYDPTRPLSDEMRTAEVLVTWGANASWLEQTARSMPRLRWVQSLAAGPNAEVAAGFAPSVTITSGRGLHDRPVAEHALGMLLGAARRMHVLRDAQRERRWAGELGGIQPLHDPSAFRSLIGAHVVVWGYGRIGQRLGAYLVAMDARVTGVARSSGMRAGVRVIDVDQVDAVLGDADALVMILPSLPSTRGILGEERLRRLPSHAWLVNVGRGDTVDEQALIAALEEGRLAGAALDVFATEPLPASSRLWGFDNVIVSPHAAGGRPLGAERLLEDNLRRLQNDEPLINEVVRP